MCQSVKAAITEYHGLSGYIINNRNLFHMVLEAGKSKIKALAHLVSGKGLLPASDTPLFAVSSRGRRD